MKSLRAGLVRQELSLVSENIKVLLGFLLLFAAAQISIPLQPVPIVLTTVGVMLIGLLYSRRTALLSVFAYVVAGACGVPVFQGFSGGFMYLFGATGGYLVGFFLAVALMSTVREQIAITSFTRTLALCTLGTVAIFIPGLLWLSHLVGISRALEFGLYPFIIPGIVKAVLLSGALRVIGARFTASRR